MSIIEKAVDKLEQKKEKPGSEPGLTVQGLDDTVERVVSAESENKPVLEQGRRATEALSPITAAAEKLYSGPVSPPQISAHSTAPPSRAAATVLQLPLDELSGQGFLTPLTPRSQIAEEFRSIKRPLLRNIDGGTAAQVENSNLIMVTSALQGDGKTFTAINLAISIALEQDKTVLFVDADMAKASAGNILGVPSDSPGLIDVLENKGVSLKDVILPTSIDNLRILPAGNVHERSTELLASRGMQNLMMEMSGRYPDRVVVFDSPPLLLTTEASVLASFMGQIAFVVSTDNTPQQAVTEALEHIGEDKIIGMVLNKAHRRRNKLLGLGFGYGYGSRYGYGYGYGENGRTGTSETDG